MLNTIVHPGPDGPPLIIAHGLFGSGRNWGVIAKRLSEARSVIAVDMRNHGDSFRADSHSYADLAGDLADVIVAHGGKADMLAHSMGGKAAMVLALTRPALVRRLIVADIAPVGYAHSQMGPLEAMRRVDLTRVTKRADAAAQMGDLSDELKAFLLQSLDLEHKRWRLNLDVLARNMADIVGFPEIAGRFDGPTLFLSGARSDYVLPDHHLRIRALFPQARFQALEGAGHWLHAEQPQAFVAAAWAFLESQASKSPAPLQVTGP